VSARAFDDAHGWGGSSTTADWIIERFPFDLSSGATQLDFICPEYPEHPDGKSFEPAVALAQWRPRQAGRHHGIRPEFADRGPF